VFMAISHCLPCRKPILPIRNSNKLVISYIKLIAVFASVGAVVD